ESWAMRLSTLVMAVLMLPASATTSAWVGAVAGQLASPPMAAMACNIWSRSSGGLVGILRFAMIHVSFFNYGIGIAVRILRNELIGSFLKIISILCQLWIAVFSSLHLHEQTVNDEKHIAISLGQ
ncbi:hypothetical protein JXA32_02920, partial [Candidatus Sumerlaeota bacterium]|nr:hypothetical protein [Candidatus Sumerlaeota bacterium]